MIILYHNDKEVSLSTVSPEEGEQKVRIVQSPQSLLMNTLDNQKNHWLIEARLVNSSEILLLVFLVDAIKSMCSGWRIAPRVTLFLPYVPYARQKSEPAPGEPFTSRAFGNFIQSLGFSDIHIVDPYSDAISFALGSPHIISQTTLFKQSIASFLDIPSVHLVSPEGTSLNKILALATAIYPAGIIQADKVIDIQTGSRVGTEVLTDPKDKHCLIVDNVCTTGDSTAQLSKILNAMGAKQVDFFVTHGIFSKGLDPLLKSGITKIYTTDSFYQFDDRAAVLRIDSREMVRGITT